MFRLASSLSLLAVGLAVASCAPSPTRPAPPPRLATVCDETQGEATMADVRAARHFAVLHLKQTIGPSRDWLAAQGIKRTRIMKPVVQCAPYALAAGMWRCVASATLCAR